MSKGLFELKRQRANESYFGEMMKVDDVVLSKDGEMGIVSSLYHGGGWALVEIDNGILISRVKNLIRICKL